MIVAGVCNSTEIYQGLASAGAGKQASPGEYISYSLLFSFVQNECPCKQELESLVTKRMEFEGMVGMAVTGGAIMIN